MVTPGSPFDTSTSTMTGTPARPRVAQLIAQAITQRSVANDVRRRPGKSVVENRQPETGQSCGVADQVDLGDPPVEDRQATDAEQPATGSEDHADVSIDEYRPREWAAR